jgi:zinc transporter ZupT
LIDQINTEIQRYGHGHDATAGLMAGFTLMMFLDVALGFQS